MQIIHIQSSSQYSQVPQPTQLGKLTTPHSTTETNLCNTFFIKSFGERNCPKQIAPKSSSEPDAVWRFTIRRRWSRQSSCGGSHHTISRPNISNCNLNQLLMPHQMVLCSTDPHSGCSPFTSKGKITFFLVIFSPPYSNKINPFVWSRFWFEKAEMGNQNAFL